MTAQILHLWKRDAGIIQQRIEADMLSLAMITKKIMEQGEAIKLRPRIMSEMPPVYIVPWFLKQQDAPIARKRLRDMIEGAGYPMDRFGPACRYFYAILKRLESKRKIDRNGNEVEWVPQ